MTGPSAGVRSLLELIPAHVKVSNDPLIASSTVKTLDLSLYLLCWTSLPSSQNLQIVHADDFALHIAELFTKVF